MLKIIEDEAHNCFVLEPSGKLEAADFDMITERFNARVNTTDRIPNLVIHTRDFPGWSDFGAFFGHLRFVRDHHKLVGKIALVSDSRVLDIAPAVGRQFLSADIRHFPAADLAAALDWVAESGDASGHVTVMTDLPDDVVGISVHDVITARDYSERIVPLIEERLKRHDKIRLLYRIGPDFSAFTAGAAWSDARVGIMHLTQFSKIAVVSDLEWIRHGTRVFAPLIPGDVHVFGERELAEAKKWITAPPEAAAPTS
jgi:hypothetical protein